MSLSFEAGFLPTLSHWSGKSQLMHSYSSYQHTMTWCSFWLLSAYCLSSHMQTRLQIISAVTFVQLSLGWLFLWWPTSLSLEANAHMVDWWVMPHSLVEVSQLEMGGRNHKNLLVWIKREKLVVGQGQEQSQCRSNKNGCSVERICPFLTKMST